MEPCTDNITENDHERPSYVTDLRMICVSLLVIVVVCSTVPVGVCAGSGRRLLSRTDACSELGIACAHGTCVDRTNSGPKCVCERGWKGPRCDSCGGRVKLMQPRGTIIDGYSNYTLDTKCTWLIEAPSDNATIRLRFRHFATECSWDHLYIYNGSSVWDPLLAIYSGLIVLDRSMENHMPEILTTGAAYLHFYSDAAYNMSGFTIDYVVDACAKDCSGHGLCHTNNYTCQCHVGWSGEDCSTQLCIRNCNSPKGKCDVNTQRCTCAFGYRGEDCSIAPWRGVWKRADRMRALDLPDGRASHQAVIQGQYMFVISGYFLGREPSQNILRYDFKHNRWGVAVESWKRPRYRYGHSLVNYRPAQSMLMFGGVVDGTATNELWEAVDQHFEFQWYRKWSSGPAPLAVAGHTAHMVGARMFVIFGHNPTYGYVNMIQVYNRDQRRWDIRKSHMAAYVKGGYGHSSVLDERNQKIYIHAGYHSGSASLYKLTDDLYEYQYTTNTMKILRASGQPRYLHSAVLLNGLILVFGGSTHNDTSTSHGAKCYSSSFMAYDIKCGTWHVLDAPKLQKDISRYGHTAVAYDGDMYIFGGFNGIVLNDLYKYSPGGCKGLTREECVQSREGVRCAWINRGSTVGCETERAALNPAGLIIDSIELPICPTPEDEPARCESFKTCPSCVGNLYNCKWCRGGCHHVCEEPRNYYSVFRRREDPLSCSGHTSMRNNMCPLQHTCRACHETWLCNWYHFSEYDGVPGKQCTFKVRKNGIISPPQQNHDYSHQDRPRCQESCFTQADCENCTSAGCMWCSNEQRCVESNSYVTTFPYGQCREWTTKTDRCPATRCEGLRTCGDCQSYPACGWCDDGDGMGMGTCMQGDPLNSTTSTCAASRWFFTECPRCQCNGHSECRAGTSQCIACTNNTAGDQCEICRDGFWGTPTNGGSCQKCDCNGQSDVCKQDNGKCFCHTKGVTGDECDTCEEKHYGFPSEGGTCFYELNTNYQFTFALSSDKKYLNRINFFNTPRNPDRIVDFVVNCSSLATFTLTFKEKGSMDPEQMIKENYTCSMFKDKFLHANFKFGGGSNITFFLYVFNFKLPFSVTVSFVQDYHSPITTALVVFLSCFLSLVVLAIIVWKTKQKYQLHRRRQRMHVEMEQMSSRPFALCAVEVSPPDETMMSPKTLEEYENYQRMKCTSSLPSFVTYEPLSHNKAAILSLVVQLPTGDDAYTPIGQSGLIFASTLVTFDNPRKACKEYKEKSKYLKHPVNEVMSLDNYL